jgi:hypothetical protein
VSPKSRCLRFTFFLRNPCSVILLLSCSCSRRQKQPLRRSC